MEQKKPNIIVDTFRWLFDFQDWKYLLRSIPSLVVTIYAVSVVVMNLMASKVVIMTPILGITGGFLISWLPFLMGDIIVKTYGAKAAIKITILGLIINLVCIGIFQLIVLIEVGAEPGTYDAFNSVFTQTWQIFVASSIAFVISGVINSITNAGIGKLFKKNPDGKGAFMCRTYISTALGQFIDNFIFAGLAFLVFFPLSVGDTFGYTIISVLGTSVLGAIIELLMEAVFSPIGYNICQKWRKEDVGAEYLAFCKSREVYTDVGRVNY